MPILDKRPIFNRLPECYQNRGLVQILNPDFYETLSCVFEDGQGVATVLTWNDTIDRSKFLYVVDYSGSVPVIEAVEYGSSFPRQYLIIPDQKQFTNPSQPISDWFTKFFDDLVVDKYYQVQRFFKEYLDLDYTLNDWLVQFLTQGNLDGIDISPSDLNWALRYWHSAEPTNEEFWVYTQDIDTVASLPIAFDRPVLHYDLELGTKTPVSNQLVKTKQRTIDLIPQPPVINTVVFDWGNTVPTPLIPLVSTQIKVLGGSTVPPSSNTTNSLWRLRGIPTNPEWLGILGSKGSADTIQFLLNVLGYYGHRSVDLVGDLFASNPTCLTRPLTLWRIPALTVETGENAMIADQSVASDPKTYSHAFIRLPASIPRFTSSDNKKCMEEIKLLTTIFSEQDSVVVSYAYFAADISLVDEPIFDSSGTLDNFYYDY